jgi:hypothetical protein
MTLHVDWQHVLAHGDGELRRSFEKSEGFAKAVNFALTGPSYYSVLLRHVKV